MGYATALMSLIGAGVTAGTAASMPTSGLGTEGIATALGLESQFRPVGYSAGLEQLNAQASFGVGASPETIGFEILARKISEIKDPKFARRAEGMIGVIQTLAMIENRSPQQEAHLQNQIARVNRFLASRGAGAQLSADPGGTIAIRFADPRIQGLLDTAREQGPDILDRRLLAQNNLSRLAADFPMASAADLDELTRIIQGQLTQDIDTSYDRQLENLLQSANTRGFNPAGPLGLVEQERARELSRTPTTAADRAIQMLSGRQNLALGSVAGIKTALSPDPQAVILNALRNQITPTTGQLAAAQIDAQARIAQAGITGRAGLAQSASSSLGDAGLAASSGF